MDFILAFFVHNNGIIKFFLPFTTSMTSKKKKKNVIYLLYLIVLKVSVTILAWYIVTIPFLDALSNGHFSLTFSIAGLVVAIIVVPGIFFSYIHLIGKRFMNKNPTMSVTSILFNNLIKGFLKIIYWLFFIVTFFMLLMKDTNEPGIEVLEIYPHLNFFTLFSIAIIYAFTNKYFEIKVHQYFYYFFNLHLNLEEYEGRIKELSKNYDIFHTKFNSHMFRSYRNLARDSRVIVLRNKYIPISFTLTYYASHFETWYDAVYQNEYTAGIRPAYENNMKKSKIHPRTQIIQKYYPEKVKKRLKVGRKKTAIPIGKLLIIGRIISILLIIILFAAVNGIFTFEAFLENRTDFLTYTAWTLGFLLVTYWFAWFYTNIVITVGMFFLIKEATYTDTKTLLILIAVTLVLNLVVLSFWKMDKIKTLLHLR